MDISDDTKFIQYGILYGMLKRSKKLAMKLNHD